MVILKSSNVMRVTVTLDPVDVDLLDRLGRLEGANRSAELRSILFHLRPMLRQTVDAFEAAQRTKDEFTLAAAQANVLELEELVPEVARIQEAVLGAMARLEGAAATARSVREAAIANGWDPAEGSPWVGPDGVTYSSKDAFYAAAAAAGDPLPSNHGGHTPLTRGNAKSSEQGSDDLTGL